MDMQPVEINEVREIQPSANVECPYSLNEKSIQSNLAVFRNIRINGEKVVDVLNAKPGEIIFVTADVGLHLAGFGPYVINQIIVGLEPTDGRAMGMKGIGAQQCILNALTQDVRPFQASFTLRMPDRPGKYDVRFNNTMEYTPKDALSHWSETSEWLLPPKEGTIATINVE